MNATAVEMDAIGQALGVTKSSSLEEILTTMCWLLGSLKAAGIMAPEQSISAPKVDNAGPAVAERVSKPASNLYSIATKRDLVSMTQSPIEEKLLRAMLRAGVPADDIQPQYSVFANGKQYYLDFAILNGDLKVCVEADGHSYHERTKQQAAHDRARDRALQLDGWMVLRFTGSEIHKDADGCAEQVTQALRLGLLS